MKLTPIHKPPTNQTMQHPSMLEGSNSPATLPHRLFHWCLLTAVIWVLLCVPVAWLDVRNRWLLDEQPWKPVIQLWLFWAVWAALPLSAGYLIRLGQLLRQPHALGQCLASALILGVLALGGWSSLVEPRLLRVQSHVVSIPASAPALRLALVSDLHLGLFWRTWQLEQLVHQLNTLERVQSLLSRITKNAR